VEGGSIRSYRRRFPRVRRRGNVWRLRFKRHYANAWLAERRAACARINSRVLTARDRFWRLWVPGFEQWRNMQNGETRAACRWLLQAASHGGSMVSRDACAAASTSPRRLLWISRTAPHAAHLHHQLSHGAAARARMASLSAATRDISLWACRARCAHVPALPRARLPRLNAAQHIIRRFLASSAPRQRNAACGAPPRLPAVAGAGGTE